MRKGIINRKVMIVDDDKELLEELKEALSLNDYDVVGVSSGITALNIAPIIKPDIILLDLNMEELNGFKVAKRLKRLSETASIPIIAMTGYFTQKEYTLAMEIFGIKTCLKKPFKPQDAIIQIEKALNEEESRISDSIDILIVEDDEHLQEELSEILSGEGYNVETTKNFSGADKELKNKFYNLVLVDIKLPDGSGIDLLKQIKKHNCETITIIITAWASIENSISALNEGAFAYLQKPFNPDDILMTVKNAIRMQKDSFENRHLLNRLKEFSITDMLTGLYNYRYLVERLTKEFERAKRYALDLSIAMLDIDFFKSINDVYGHNYGDQILKDFAAFLRDFVRGCDIVARYGGEEFVIILPNTVKDSAVVLGERLLDKLKKYIFDPEGKKVKLEISMGIANFPEDCSSIDSASDFLSLSDTALLNAKESGRNRLAIYNASGRFANGASNKDITEDAYEVREKLILMEKSVNQTLLESVYAFAKTIYAADYYPNDYIENMISLTEGISRKLGLGDKALENLKRAALLHDLGKIGIPEQILLKKDRISAEEFRIVKMHPQIAVEIIRPISLLRDLIPIIYYHHERFDGAGYSAGLKGREIPLGARIMAIVDTYQALVSDRPYRKAYKKEKALEIIEQSAGRQFDPKLVETFIKVNELRGKNAEK